MGRKHAQAVPTYAEVALFGTGLRLFGFGCIPDGGTQSDIDGTDGHLEMYETGRYLTVTGHALDIAPADVRKVKEEIADLHAKSVRPGGTGTPTHGYKALGFTDDAPDVDDMPERGSGQQRLG